VCCSRSRRPCSVGVPSPPGTGCPAGPKRRVGLGEQVAVAVEHEAHRGAPGPGRDLLGRGPGSDHSATAVWRRVWIRKPARLASALRAPTSQRNLGHLSATPRHQVVSYDLWQDRSVVADEVLLIEQLAANAWPAATVQLVDGWLLRHTPGVARRRSNSALPSPGATCASTAQRAQILDLAERFYARRSQPTVVQVSPAALHDQLDRELAARGYLRQAPTVVLTAPIHRVPVPAPTTSALAVAVADAVTSRWLAAWTAIEARPDAAATNQEVLARISPPAGYLTASHDRDVVGVGMLVVERSWAGVFCMATRPQNRRRGVATALLQHAACWAADQGAHQLYLQVEEDNLPALQLYRRFGFQPSHHYHYRVATP
jgi:N-acetylglutamate synthase